MERWLESAYHLGLRLVVLGPQGWWLQEPGASKAVEKFIPLDIKKDDGYLQKLLDALSDDMAHISGITTFTDTCMTVVAEVAEKLGLPTAPSIAIKTSTDKHKTRKALQSDTQPLRVSNLNDLKHQIRIIPEPLAYPVIAKPCFAWGSNGVHFASTVSELYLAVETLEQAYPGIDVMTESYEIGPEFDANFVLRDGKILFFEVVDNFPCTAELDSLSSEAKKFMETDMVWPSALPQSEQDLIGRTLQKQLLLLGFRTGVFHVEGRVRNSASAQNSKGIQTLLDAEREAQKIVQRAREYRSKRVKDAKNEAQKEIEDYRKQKDDEFKEFEKKHTSGNKQAEEDASKDADEQLKQIKERGSKTGDTVVEDLLRVVTEVKPEVPDRVTAPPEA